MDPNSQICIFILTCIRFDRKCEVGVFLKCQISSYLNKYFETLSLEYEISKTRPISLTDTIASNNGYRWEMPLAIGMVKF